MNLKRLPRDEAGKFKPFFNGKSGKKYQIRSPEDGIGILRYSMLVKMSSSMGFGVGMGDQLKNWKEISDLIHGLVENRNTLPDIFALVKAQFDGIA